MREIRDLIDAIPPESDIDEVTHLLRTAYYRGAEHYKQDSDMFNERRNKRMEEYLLKIFKEQ